MKYRSKRQWDSSEKRMQCRRPGEALRRRRQRKDSPLSQCEFPSTTGMIEISLECVYSSAA
jgi:hypothetical protein